MPGLPQLRAGVPDRREDMVRGFVERFPTLDPELIRNAVYASGELVDWFVEKEDVGSYFRVMQMGPHRMYGLPQDRRALQRALRQGCG